MRVRTGVEGFDPIVGGGLPEGASVVLQGPAGNEKDLFGLQFLAEGLRSGEALLIVVSSQSPEQYLESLAKLDVNVKEAIAGNRVRVVDWHAYRDGNVAGVEERDHIIRASVDLTNVGIALSRALGTLVPGVPRRAVLEVLSPALQVFEVGQVYAFAQSS
ncbi:MAG TPA: RAD55 family ATPase, partial [Thermoplasmata archaeon]|nr:RAD55 family ATPase [Thermoplasmata archaeon]